MNELLVYCTAETPRIRYIFDWILNERLGLRYTVTSDVAAFRTYTGPKINYSHSDTAGKIFISPAALLFEKDICEQPFNCSVADGTKVLFANDGEALFPFDVFAASFFLVSRYEEYLPFRADEHGRFPAELSLAFREGFLSVPIVDQWINALKAKLHELFSVLVFVEHQFSYKPTIDVDSVWSYKGKGAVRSVGGLVRDALHADLKKVTDRVNTLSGKRTDPFDTFETILTIKRKWDLDLRFFFLLGYRSLFDKNIPHTDESAIELIRHVCQQALWGLHPSYASNDDEKLLCEEIQRLHEITGQPVTHSRQHFLKLKMPDTYRNLAACGIQHDHTMGYTSLPGFRAGTSFSFAWYDLAKEEATSLRIHPLIVMDGILKDRMKLNQEKALEILRQLIDVTAGVQGTFSLLWHNHSFDESSDWKGWGRVFEEASTYALRKIN